MTLQGSPDKRLHGRWLAFARLIGLSLILFAGAIFSIGIVVRYGEFQRVCDQPAVSCAFLKILMPNDAQSLANLGLSLRFYALFQVGSALLNALVWCGVALFIFINRSEDWLALITTIFFILFGTQGGYWQGAARLYPVLTFAATFLTSLSWATFALFFALFPNGRVVPRWMGWIVLIWIIVFSLPARLSDQIPAAIGALLFFGFFACVIYSQIYRYRHVSTITERLKTKWVVYGVTISLLSIMILSVFLSTIPAINFPGSPGYIMIQSLGNSLFVFIPLSVGMAMLRSHLWDIDLIIRRTLQYTGLTVALGLVFSGSIIALQAVFVALSGQRSAAAVVMSTLAISVLFFPLRRRLQNIIDRRFYRRKYDAQKTLEGFAARARDEVELEQLTAHLVSVVQETMQPETVSLWLRDFKK